jgi:group I intron endonuclease
MIIYKTINLINGKIYIGQDLKNSPKYLGSGRKLLNAVKKYGKENFKKEILEYCHSQEELDLKEKMWINKLNSRDRKIGYNIAEGGQEGSGWFSGCHHSEECKKKMSIQRKGKLVGEKNGMFGKRHSEESRKKMSRPTDGERNGMFGKKHSEDAKKKNSESHLGEKNNFFGKKHTKESKEKMRKKALGRIAHNRKKVLVGNVMFNSITEAAIFFNLTASACIYRCKKKILNWSYSN